MFYTNVGIDTYNLLDPTIDYCVPSEDEDGLGLDEDKTLICDKSTILRIMREGEILEKRIRAVAKAYAELTGEEWKDDADITEISETSIDFNWTSGCSRGCCTDYHSLSVPTKYLWEEEWQSTAVAERLLAKARAETEERIRKEAARVEAEKAAKIRKEKEEREQLEKLKAKYEASK